MIRRNRQPLSRTTLASVTFLAILGTLLACGRYGSPVRVAPGADPTLQTESREEADSEDDAERKANRWADEEDATDD